MRIATVSATVAIATMLVGASAAPVTGEPVTPSTRAYVPAHPTACDIKLNIIDQDPHGVNVRATPQVLPNNIRTVIRHAEWSRVHVVAQAGDWYQIDSYERMNDGQDDEQNDLPGGRLDWVHASELGGADAKPGGFVYAAPNNRGKPIHHFTMDESKLPKVTVIGCQGQWYHVKVGGAVGWTQSVCTNERTTCV